MPEKPNVVFVFSDTHRWGAMSFTQTPEVATPNMAAVKDAGVTFDRCYSNLPICTPYRAILMTGRWPWQQGLMANHMQLRQRVDRPEGEKERGTLGHVFRDAGYRTFYVGKWHLGPNNAQPFGFDESLIWTGEDHGVMTYLENGAKPQEWTKEKGYTGIPAHPPHPAYPDHEYKIVGETDQALNLMDEHAKANDGKPFFLILSLQDPHGPFSCIPPHLLDRYPEEESLPFAPNDQLRKWKSHRVYHQSVEAVDEQLGRVREKIESLGIAENTILVYTSDHGGMGGAERIGYGQKRMPHDNSSRVPFLIQWPERIPAGVAVDSLFSSVDIFPTLCQLANLDTHLGKAGTEAARESLGYLEDCPGLDFSNNALGKPGGADPNSVYVAHPSNMNNNHGKVQVHRTVVTKDHMYSVKPDGEWLLYDLASDPYQMKNRIDDPSMKDVKTDLRRELTRWVEDAETQYLDRWFANAAEKELEAWNREHDIEPLDDREAGRGAGFDTDRAIASEAAE